jgi:hypothetical protein
MQTQETKQKESSRITPQYSDKTKKQKKSTRERRISKWLITRRQLGAL